MATSITITITPTRALTVEGRLVAGETAEVTIGGATPTALYLVAPDQTVVAACEAFTPTGQGSGGVGFLQLATEQVAALFAHTPAGRMVAVWALVNDADGVAGAGWIPVVSAPMPDELVDLDIDFYLRASQVGAGLAIVDGKLVCTVNPAPVQSVNGRTGAVVLTGADIETASGSGYSVLDAIANITQDLETIRADLRYALPADPLEPDPETGKYALNDREANWIQPDGASVTLVFPAPIPGRLRDFEVYIASYSSGTGNLSLTCEAYDASEIISIGNGAGAVPDIPLGGDTVLYFSEVKEGGFLLKGEEFRAITGGN